MTNSEETPRVGIVMGSTTDWDVMQRTTATLRDFGVPYEVRVLSAHRTPDETAEWARTAEERGLRVLIAAAGGAAHLAGVVAAHTLLPVLGVPMQAWSLDGLDSLLAMAQMPRGIPVATLAIGSAGATNAALLAVEILALNDAGLRQQLADFRASAGRGDSGSVARIGRRDSRRPRELDSRVGWLNILSYPNGTSAVANEPASPATQLPGTAS